MINIKKIRYLFFLICFLSALKAQKSVQTIPTTENQIGIASGFFINYGNAGTEADGYVEFQTRSGLFIESSAAVSYTHLTLPTKA